MARKVIIGSRGSDLALWQAHFTKQQLEGLGHSVEILIIKTKGDQIQHLSFDKIEGKGFFTKELEDSLLAGNIDLAVHSHKDLPTTYPPGLTIAGVSYREDCSESLLIRPEARDKTRVLSLRRNARVGTSSFRRRSQLLNLRPDLEISDLRGNVPTRVDKLQQGNYDAIILASAGLNRLELDLGELHREILPPDVFIPAPAQGVLAYQIREDDQEMKHIVSRIHHVDVKETIYAERAVLNRLDGGCLLPLGVFCERKQEGFQLWASLQPLDGKPFRRVFLRDVDPESLAKKTLIALTRQETRRVFISREPELATGFSQQLLDYGFHVEAFSPITFESIEIRHIPFAEWIFFTSPRSVHYFYQQNIQLPFHMKVAALGSGTAAALQELGVTPEFTGKDLDTSEVGKDFLEFAAHKSVLFPCAEKSLRSIQNAIHAVADVHDLPVYRTIEKGNEQTTDADILVFTSPSSVNAMKDQFLSDRQTFVAIGQSTADALTSAGISEVHIAPFTTLAALADLVCGL
jgi:hydroxymethylbilane synthase